MPRANRLFLPGYVWHITINAAAGPIVPDVQSLRSVQVAEETEEGTDFFRARDHRRYPVSALGV